MIDHSCQVRRHLLAERGADCYGTPPVAVEALLRVEQLPHRLWEPCCGHGNIVDVLRAHGHEVIGSDLIDYGRPDFFSRRDFLLEWKAPDGCECIITNPPFQLAEQFVAHALDLARASSCCCDSHFSNPSGDAESSKVVASRACTSFANACR
jgi:hypothetical protein